MRLPYNRRLVIVGSALLSTILITIFNNAPDTAAVNFLLMNKRSVSFTSGASKSINSNGVTEKRTLQYIATGLESKAKKYSAAGYRLINGKNSNNGGRTELSDEPHDKAVAMEIPAHALKLQQSNGSQLVTNLVGGRVIARGIKPPIAKRGKIVTEATEDNNHVTKTWTRTSEENVQGKRYKVVMYKFTHQGMKNGFTGVDINTCQTFRNCDMVLYQGEADANKTDLLFGADAVVIQGNSLPRPLPVRKDINQTFVFHSVESPHEYHTTLYNKVKPGYFNWTMTYRLDSNIPHPYGSVLPGNVQKQAYMKSVEETGVYANLRQHWLSEPISDTDSASGIVGKNYSEIFRKKDPTKGAIWLVSHCITASRREGYVSQMKKVTKVDKVGSCSGTRNVCPKMDANYCRNYVVENYKFYLAFENSICNGYITEKAYHWFDKDIILVVRGARHYQDFLPPNTYIDADKFKSAIDLGLYLDKLGSDEAAYTAMLRRKDMYRVISAQETRKLAYCHLCYRLNNMDKFRSSVNDIYDWWERGQVCDRVIHPPRRPTYGF